MPEFVYAVLGSGRQGTSAAFDLARHGQAAKIIFFDRDPQAAQRAKDRINQLLDQEIAVARELDVSQQTRLIDALDGVDVTLSAVPYTHNLDITKACIASGSGLCDMGGHTDTVTQQLELDGKARSAGVSIVPDCGMGPGLNITMAAYVMEQLDDPRHIYIYDGGLPQHPKPPWNYTLTFHINGLTNEMDGHAYYIRDGQVTAVETLTEAEWVDFAPLGKLEADVTSGGLSTSPWTFADQLLSYENKTLRYPGHFEWLRAYKALGLFSEQPLDLGGQPIAPRRLFHALLEPKIRHDHVRDVCLIRVIGRGIKDGESRELILTLIDYYDENTGFTAMERLTGWHCAIMMSFQARGEIKAGCHAVQSAISPDTFMTALRGRGIQFDLQSKIP